MFEDFIATLLNLNNSCLRLSIRVAVYESILTVMLGHLEKKPKTNKQKNQMSKDGRWSLAVRVTPEEDAVMIQSELNT